MVEFQSDTGVEIGNATNPMYTIYNPNYDQNNTGYYCVATNNEGIAVSNTSTLTGNALFIISSLKTNMNLNCVSKIKYAFIT